VKNKVTLVVVVLLCALLLQALRPSTAIPVARVAKGVTLAGMEIAGWTEMELEAHLESVQPQLFSAPVEPSYDKVQRGVIPGLAGRELDIAATLAHCLGALPQTSCDYVFRPVLPSEPSLELPIFQGNPDKRKIAFVINVAWGNEELSEILDILDYYKLQKTFFLVGRWVSKYPELVREVYRRGHELANHAYSDLHLSQQSSEKIRDEILRTTAAIVAAVGPLEIRFFSPSYNDFDQEVIQAAAALGYQTVLCSLDTADWMRQGADQIVRRIVPRAHNGAIVLMHPARDTPRALRIMIPLLKQKGFALVTLGELLSPLP